MRDVGRYHKLPWGGGQITIPSDLAEKINLKNKDKVMIEYNEKTEEMRIIKL